MVELSQTIWCVLALNKEGEILVKEIVEVGNNGHRSRNRNSELYIYTYGTLTPSHKSGKK